MAPAPNRTRDESGRTRPETALPTGTRLRDEYQVGAVLGTGSFGITYRARDEHLDTTVAIKEYYPTDMARRTGGGAVVEADSDDADDFSFGMDQFRQEGRTLARFDHPNVVDVRSYFEENGTGYLVMDYYEGGTLAEYVAQNGGVLAETEARALMRDVMEGLHAVHAEGVLHRDITPQNIYRTSEGRGVLIDFGAAREAMSTRGEQSAVILTPGYAPPEQHLADGRQGPYTDVYACAATLYRCLTGLKPQASTDRVQEDKLVSPQNVRSEVSMETSVAVMKGLALDAERRPASVSAFATLLGGEAAGEQASGEDGASGATDQTTTRTAQTTIEDPAGNDSETTFADGQWTERSEPSAARFEAPVESSGGSAVAVAVGLLGVVGTTLLMSDVGAVEVLSFFGTWLAVCFGLVGLFREGEKVMSGESRAAVSDWLLQENFAARHANWPATFVSLFDALFTTEHLSWTCFRRSAITSVLVITVLFGGFVGFGLITLPSSLGGLAEIAALLGIPIALNVVIDYASLFETRWILGKMSMTDSAFAHVGYLGIDLVLTGLCIILPVSILQIFGLGVMTEFSIWTSAFWYQLFSALLNMMELFVTITAEGLGEIPRVMSVMLFSTMFTSVWVWLYAVAGLLLRLLRPVLESLDWLKHHLNVETRPVHAMGMLLAILTSIGFAIGAPFVL